MTFVGDMVVDETQSQKCQTNSKLKLFGWMKKLVVGRNYYFKFESKILNGTKNPIKKIDINTFKGLPKYPSK